MAQDNSNFNIILIGDTAVGKTSILKRYTSNKYSSEEAPTIGVEQKTKKIDQLDTTIKIKIIDPSGQPKFKGLITNLYKQVNGVLLIYDVTNRKSFTNIQQWLAGNSPFPLLSKDVKKYCSKNIHLSLIANKIDQKKVVQSDEARRYANSIQAKFIECSAQSNTNIYQIFQSIYDSGQVKMYQGSAPNKTKDLIVKLNVNEVESKNIVSLKTNKSKQETSQDEYLDKLWKENHLSLKAKKMAEKFVMKQEVDIYKKLHLSEMDINKNKDNLDDSFQKMSEEADLEQLIKQQRYQELNKVRKEIAASLLYQEEHINTLKFDQVDEKKEAQQIKRNLTDKLLEVEKTMSMIRCEQLLTKKGPSFQTAQQNYRSLDESLMNKLQISQITQPDHFNQQQELLKKLIEERQRIEEKRKRRIKENEEAIKKEEIELKELQKAQKEEENQKKREVMSNHIEEIKQRIKDRESNIEQQKQKMKELYDKKLLLHKMNERYEKKFELPELERRKLKMLELKESHKRLTIDELLERGKKYDQEKLEKEKKRKEEQENRLKDFHFHPSYKSENYQKVKEETTKLKHFKENEVKQLQDRVNAKKTYSAMTREEFLPSINEDKRQEMEQLKEKTRHTANYKEYVDMAKKVKEKGQFFDIDGNPIQREIDEKHYDELKDQLNEESLTPRAIGKQYLKSVPKFRKDILSLPPNKEKKNDVTLSAINDIKSVKEKEIVRTKDYLKEVKSSLNLRKKDIRTDWERIVQNDKIDTYRKDEQLRQEAKHMEEEALKKERVMRARMANDEKYLKELDEVDDILVNSIKAKLSVLDKKKTK